MDEAIDDAVSRGWIPGAKTGLLLATTRGDVRTVHDLYDLEGGDERSAERYVASLPTTAIATVSAMHGLSGPTMVLNSGCAAGLSAFQVADALMAVGAASDVIVVGAEVGVDAQTTLPLAQLGPLSFDNEPSVICRPFRDDSKGFVLGEAAAALVLNRNADAGHTPLFRTLGVESANDHYHPTSINPNPVTVTDLVDATLARAGVQRSEVYGVLCHGSGTVQCSKIERIVIDYLNCHPSVVVLKPMVGHCRGAASILEVIVLAACGSKKLPTVRIDPGTSPGDSNTGGPIWLQMAFGFGGNAAFAVHRYND